jgi:hypothetical protein
MVNLSLVKRIRTIIKPLLLTLLHRSLFDWLLERYIYFHLTTIVIDPNARLVVLILSEKRFRDDLTAIKQHPGWSLFGLPVHVQDRINEIANASRPVLSCLRAQKGEGPKDPHEARIIYLQRIIRKLSKKKKIDCMLSSTMFSKKNEDWEIAGEGARCPFFALHREGGGLDNSLTRRVLKGRVAGWRKFRGDKLFVGTPTFRDILVEDKYLESRQLEVVGLPRVDVLLKTSKQKKNASKQFVLFSFEHNVCLRPLLQKPRIFYKEGHGYLYGIQKFFPDGRGFSSLFEITHGRFALMAIRNPDYEMYIKVKWYSFDWKHYLDQAIKKITGKAVEEIDNLHVTDKISAIDLMQASTAVIAFNSTVIAEAILLDVPVIVPIFEEAAENYKEHIAWAGRPGITFAETPELLEDLLKGNKEFEHLSDKNKYELLDEAFGFSDGNNTQRLQQSMIKYIQMNMSENCEAK